MNARAGSSDGNAIRDDVATAASDQAVVLERGQPRRIPPQDQPRTNPVLDTGANSAAARYCACRSEGMAFDDNGDRRSRPAPTLGVSTDSGSECATGPVGRAASSTTILPACAGS